MINNSEIIGKNNSTFIHCDAFNIHINFEDAIKRKKGKPFYIFLLIVPSNYLTNITHVVSFIFAKRLQDDFYCPVIIIPKHFFVILEKFKKNPEDIILDIFSINSNKEKTAIIMNTQSINL